MFRSLAVFLGFLSLLLLVPLSARAQQDLSQIPEQNGDYPDPEHPGIRVRVFVHEPKSQKPGNALSTSCPDSDSSATTGATGWKLPQGNWTYNLNPSSVPSSISTDNFASISANAFSQWQTAVGGKINFQRGVDTDQSRTALDGKNIVSWGRAPGTALAVTYTRYNQTTGLVVDVDTILNKKFPWSWTSYVANQCANPDSYDAQDILTHELGHWMGLDDEYSSSYVNNTMYGYGAKGEIKKDTLTSGDTLGVQSLYP